MFYKKKKKALKKSIYINKGYKILKNPIKRMQYILKLNGFDLKLLTININLNQNFLNKQFKYYKILNQIKTKKNNINQINLFYKKINQLLKKYIKKILEKFKNKSWKKSFIIFQKILFLYNFKKKIRKIKSL
ncbi:Fe-S protein assembly co-chaperone HscB [Buchnera aphidicola]|uniref:Fe-S protein assembly co-chaperone HscB n=1 Tax=Buchnera aphidicola TaxID=9 RepID=UPI002238AEE9|nr:Fe-S protein assembly co-chaperone HscB [Buchnera aphidicola]MCW5197426.1 Fe-S protein assembly co-chaperone HscB [Buchnera aphidicola (Chaitophorus viminalis)]